MLRMNHGGGVLKRLIGCTAGGFKPKMAKEETPRVKQASSGASKRKGEVPPPAASAGAGPPEDPPPAVATQPAAPASAAAPDPVVVVELVNGVDGVWKKLSNGKRIDLTTKEWRQELTRLFTRPPAH